MTTPFGIYDLKRNQGFMFIGTSDETSELACDAIGLWWEKWGKEAYPQAESLLILCDSGGSLRADVPGCSYELNKVDLQNLANRLGMELRITHYPSYASKYNPIEHRLFPHVHRVCNGIIFKDAAMVASQMATATTKTGLKVAAEVMEKVYKKGRKDTIR